MHGSECTNARISKNGEIISCDSEGSAGGQEGF